MSSRTKRSHVPDSSDGEDPPAVEPPKKKLKKKKRKKVSNESGDDFEDAMTRIRAMSRQESSSSKAPLLPTNAGSSKRSMLKPNYHNANAEANAGLKRKNMKENQPVIKQTKKTALHFGNLVVLPGGIRVRENQLPYFELKNPVNVTAMYARELETKGLAAINLINGFYIYEDDTTDDIMQLLKDHLPRLWRFLQLASVPNNPYYEPGTHHRSLLKCRPVMFCGKSRCSVSPVAGNGGVAPDGRCIKQVANSKRNGGWAETIVIFASFKTIPQNLIDEWDHRLDPDPVWYYRSSDSEEDVEEVSSPPRKKGKGKARADVGEDFEEVSFLLRKKGKSKAKAVASTHQRQDINSDMDDDLGQEAEDGYGSEDDEATEFSDFGDNKESTRCQTRSMAKASKARALSSSNALLAMTSVDDQVSSLLPLAAAAVKVGRGLETSESLSASASSACHNASKQSTAVELIQISSDDEFILPTVQDPPQVKSPSPVHSFFTRRLAEEFKNDHYIQENIFTSGRRMFNFDV